eukprot:COSAG01_NODE_821_length_13328_cov_2.385441_8_plen_124_part_00
MIPAPRHIIERIPVLKIAGKSQSIQDFGSHTYVPEVGGTQHLQGVGTGVLRQLTQALGQTAVHCFDLVEEPVLVALRVAALVGVGWQRVLVGLAVDGHLRGAVLSTDGGGFCQLSGGRGVFVS